MFLDEPTSGLDSFMAQSVVQAMKTLADKGKTIISTIHQPSSEVFALFDRVLLMGEGRLAYLGQTQGAVSFFKGKCIKVCRGTVEPRVLWGSRGLQAHGFESCPRSEGRLGFLTRGNGFLAGGL
ncbi:Protein white [Portunus trituberculatus]|uniref:Protein white n=1 Tax=Portunus trituberculatus TaxID=210409 RepID=A0A5B7JUU1_PORTR|nr:Protein white [Portunus trituberculatus]